MTTYSAITEAETDTDAPGTSSLWKRWWKNPLAMFEGATGAPRLQGLAAARPTNGLPALTIAVGALPLIEGLTSVVGDLTVSAFSDVAAHTFTMLAYSGVVRLSASHRMSAAEPHYLAIYKNGSLVQSWSSTLGSTTEVRTVDVTFAAGDVLQWRHRVAGGGGTSTVSAITILGSDRYVTQPLYIPESLI
jgi:hypothetical protein